MIITMASTKGGSGKSTSAATLASGLLNLKPECSVALIDTDPQMSITSFLNLRSNMTFEKSNLTGFGAFQSDGIVEAFDAIMEARSNNDFVIVDLQGAASEYNTMLMGISNLLIIPTRLNMFDLVPAQELYDWFLDIREQMQEHVECRILCFDVQAWITNDEKKLQDEMKGMELPMFETVIRNRGIYRSFARSGRLLHEIKETKYQQNNLLGAQAESKELAAEVLSILSTMKTKYNREEDKGHEENAA